MKKLLILLVWLLGLAGIAWLCSSGQYVPPPLPASDIPAPKVAPPAGAGATGAAPAAAARPSAAAPAAAAPTPAVRAAAAKIDDVLKDKVVEFRSGSATLTLTGMATLGKIQPVLKDNPSLKFEIQGHTDNTGSEPGNLALSQARAEAVQRYLAAQGVAPERMTAKGYGASKPVADNNTYEGRTRNRRIAFGIEENK